MSVPVNQRTEGKLEACLKAHDLCCYTLQITSNQKNFPEKYQHSLTDKIIDAAIEIHVLAWSANNVYVNSPEDFKNRTELQEAAAIKCNVLISLIEVAHRVYQLSGKRVYYWTSKAVDTRNLIRAWKDKDHKRYSPLYGG